MRVEVCGLTRRFGQVTAVDDVSFEFGAGQVFGFIGPNGAGKTTTMRMLATLEEADDGDAFIGGISVRQYPEKVRRLIGFMPDSLPSQKDLSVADYLDFFARAFGLSSAERRRVIAGIVDFTGLGPLRDKQVAKLSKGMKQRVSVARTLIHDPPVLILDEPASGLDPRARVELRDLLRVLAGQGKAILVSSHILGELGEICDGTVIIESGKIVRAGSMAEVLNGTAHRLTLYVRAVERSDELHRALLERPEVEEVRLDGRGIEVSWLGDEGACAGLLTDLVTAGFAIVEFGPRQGDLESVFLRLTRGELQ
jgi:ABC-2 type transport system ATP-binding protein